METHRGVGRGRGVGRSRGRGRGLGALSDSNIIYAPAFTGDAAVTSHPPAQHNLVDASLRETHDAVDKPPDLPVHACRPASGLPQQLLIVPL